MRNEKLDVFRGMVILYIVGVIHMLYWSGFITYKYKSLFLIEMPIIFYIMGATFILKPQKFTILYFIKRFLRCMIPFYFYAAFVLAINVKNNYLIVESLNFFKIFDPLLRYNQISFLNYHLWFIPIYIIFIPIIPIYYKYYKKNEENTFSLYKIILGFCILLLILDVFQRYGLKIKGNYYIRNIIFYSIYVFLGFSSSKKLLKFSKKIHLLFSLLGIIIILCLKNFYSLDMQINKFPPNFIFLVYTLIIFNFLAMFNNILLNIYTSVYVIRKVVYFYAVHNFILYLWHPIVYLFVFYMIKKFNIKVESSASISIIGLIIVFLNMINGYLFNWTECVYKKILKKLK